MRHTKWGIAKASLAALTFAAALAALTPTPAAAEHKCDEPNPCLSYTHAHNDGEYDRDVFDWTPRRFDTRGSHDWFGAYAQGLGSKFKGTDHNYHYTYATGGRLLDSHAAWYFYSSRQDDKPLRGLFQIRVRIPRDDTATRNATSKRSTLTANSGI